ncbi:MAG: sigma-54 dependent transcriptional regulator [Tannerella sp.]|jgi:two-component system response regulator HydG|nr:sigma-54 dependent transcriptional regulator [Tannerella sp.]
MNRQNILIIEDDTAFGKMLQTWFGKNGYSVSLCTGVAQAKKELSGNEYKLIITDLCLPDGDGILLLSWIKEMRKETPVIIMTGYGEIQSAVSAIKRGAFDYLEKPVNPSVLKEKVELALNVKESTSFGKQPISPVPGNDSDVVSSDIVYGKSKVAQEMFEYIRIVAPTKMSVLITGENGTGKEYAARMIHQQSRRKDAPFIALDCGSLSKELAPSELFGHLKGSFTSAMSDKIGVFEAAKGGTVFLDEVGNLSYDVQVQLLRVLQELKVRPVGSTSDIKVDVRIVVATNEDLLKAIAEGRFREDLYHRLNEFNIVVPPLRERLEDIPHFVDCFIESANKELEKEIKGCSPEALSLLRGYRWSGNLRELKNVIKRAVLFAHENEITPDSLPDFILSPAEKDNAVSLYNIDNEKERIERALEYTGGNKAAAARLLKIDRKTLYNKMHQYGMEIGKYD